MRVAIICDIHANITALKAVLDDLHQQNVEKTYCLGDLVGYAAHPNEVIDRIRRNETPTIMGNYDDVWASTGMNVGAPIEISRNNGLAPCHCDGRNGR